MKPRSRILGACIAGLLLIGLAIALTSEPPPYAYMCSNNLKQIGLALINYHVAWETFPSGTVPNPKRSPEKRLSWLVTILPWREGGGPWLVAHSKAWDEGENRLIRRGEKETDESHVAENLYYYRCPASKHTVDPAGQGLSDYVAVAGMGADAPGLPTTARRRKQNLDDRAADSFSRPG